MGEEMRELRSTNRQLQNSHGDIKYSIGNGVAKELEVAKELIHMTHGYEQWWGELPEGVGGAEWKGPEGEK